MSGEAKCHRGLERSVPEITMFRGDSFAIRLVQIEESKTCQELLKQFRDRGLTIQRDDVSYRVLSHWDTQGLLVCERGGKKGWRRFNLTERLWAQVIIELRKLGTSLDVIREAKPFFFESIHDECSFSFVEYYCLTALLSEIPTHFIVLTSGEAVFLDCYELEGAQEWTSLNHFISLSLNSLLSNMLKRSVSSKRPSEESVEHRDLIDIINSEDFDHMKIIKNKGRVNLCEYQKSYSGKQDEQALTEGYDNYSISRRIVNGICTSKTRTVKVKLGENL